MLVLQAEMLRKVYSEIPTPIMKSNIVDISSYNEADTHSRIDAFVKTLESYKKRRSQKPNSEDRMSELPQKYRYHGIQGVCPGTNNLYMQKSRSTF